MPRLRILITNQQLVRRAGTELVVRDLALGLLNRGHLPIVYSPELGEVAAELRRATVPVVADLAAVGEAPDLIHGHHHGPTMAALLHFLDAPAIYFCHSWFRWEEWPPRFPRILRYLAVDQTCRDRVVCENGIAADRVRVVPNFVDLERFRPRGPLPAHPRRALMFSNYAMEGGYLETVRAACRRAGLDLEVIGFGVGASCDRPEDRLGSYDLVFAKGRAALEALACGTAVVLCDCGVAGPMVTAGELERLRAGNFGMRCQSLPVTADHLLQEIRRYDPADAAEVSRRVRAIAGREAALDDLLMLYEEVIEEFAAGPGRDRQAEGRAAAAYLRSLFANLQARRQRRRPVLEFLARISSPWRRLAAIATQAAALLRSPRP